jgi:hypothetical protein
MALRRLGLAVLLAAGALALAAGCGGGTTSDPGSAAALVPKSAPVYVEVATDEDGDQWRTAADLLQRLPFGAAFSGELDGVDGSDVAAALGPESALVVLDPARGDETVVGLTQPDDVDAFKSLAADDDSAVREIDGWWAIADSEAVLDRFEEARKDGSLADEEGFQQATDGLTGDRLALVYANPEAGLASAPAAGMLDEGALRCVTGGDEQQPVALAVSATDGGFELHSSESPVAFDVTSAASGLDDRLPAGALAFASVHDGAAALRHMLDCVEDSLGAQLSQLEALTGISVENDLLALFEGETALAVYPGAGPGENQKSGWAPYPGGDAGLGAALDPGGETVTVLTEVDDPEDVLNRFDRHLASLGPLFGNLRVTTKTIDGLDVRTVVSDGSPALSYAASDGLLAVSTSPQGVLLVQGTDGRTLAEDPHYVDARDAAGVPDETAGFFYLDLGSIAQTLMPASEDSAGKGLGGLVVWGDEEGDGLSAQGFLAID